MCASSPPSTPWAPRRRGWPSGLQPWEPQQRKQVAACTRSCQPSCFCWQQALQATQLCTQAAHQSSLPAGLNTSSLPQALEPGKLQFSSLSSRHCRLHCLGCCHPHLRLVRELPGLASCALGSCTPAQPPSWSQDWQPPAGSLGNFSPQAWAPGTAACIAWAAVTPT